MGYRSEVCLGLTDDAVRLLRTLLDHVPAGHEVHALIKDADHGQRALENYKDPDADCETKFYWNYIKWYEGYECVDFIESFLSDCVPEEDYRFVRIGEESDDVQECGEFWDSEIYVTRSISW